MFKVLFFAQLREVLDSDGLSVDADVSSAGELRARLMENGPLWQEYLHPSRCLVAVNQTMVDDQAPIQDGDEIAFFPPVTGG